MGNKMEPLRLWLECVDHLFSDPFGSMRFIPDHIMMNSATTVTPITTAFAFQLVFIYCTII